MRLPVGSVVFVSHRQVCEGILLCKFFRQKIFPDQRKTEQFFSMKPNLQSQKGTLYEAGGKGKGVGSPSFDTLVRVSEGSFHEKQSAMPRTAGVSGNVPEEKGIKKCG